jgi:hypothetical protein
MSMSAIVMSFLCRLKKTHHIGEVLPDFLLTILFFTHHMELLVSK